MKQQGLALISVIILSSLIGTLAVFMYLSVENHIKVLNNQILSEKRFSAATFMALQTAVSNSGSVPTATSTCFDSYPPQSGMARTVCLLQNLASSSILNSSQIDLKTLKNSGLFPLFDYNQLFRDLTPCSPNHIEHYSPEENKSWPSLPSLKASITCKAVPETTNAQKVSINGNLRIGDIQYSITPTITPFTFAISGFVQVNSLNINSPLIIVAGGDIQIGTIAAAKDTELLLISATGNIRVNKVMGQLQVRAIAFQNVALPIQTSMNDLPLPPIVWKKIVSISPSSKES